MSNAQSKRISTLDLAAKKASGQKWAMLTCYEQMVAAILDEANIPVLLVGDSAGNNFLGYENTIPVTVDELIPLARAVVSATNKAMVVADLPFGSYENSPEQALVTGVRFFKEAKVQAVKLEGGKKVVPQIEKLIAAGIPVMGHLGLTPQSVHKLGGYKVQGRGEDGERIKSDARALAGAGVFAIVLEAVPADLAKEITQELSIPIIGIGAGIDCDGQVLVWTDLMGITENPPKLAKAYRNLRKEMVDAATEFANDVASGHFPTSQQSFN
ncbi:MAG: 3-methyl-2-oxobutanoate hydroxymethyltransferase [Candidatus Nanopelagicus sp.]